MANVRLHVPDGLAFRALRIAIHFAGQYPDRIGRNRSVGYSDDDGVFWAYRTKAGTIVVRGEEARQD